MASRSICVYCGSRVGDRAAYVEQATVLGQAIADNGWRLVYGAGDIGLMGTVARAAQGAGAETFGVIPTHFGEGRGWENRSDPLCGDRKHA
jgi:uncharacterized protein (TIGR00730 family)